MAKEVIIIGCGGHGKVIEEIIKKSGDIVFGFLDDDSSKKGVIGILSESTKYTDKYFVIGIGNNKVRKSIAEKYKYLKFYTAIHPSAVIADSARICEGTVVMPNAVVNSDAFIGVHCIVNTAAVVEHDCNIGGYVHISPSATLCGTVSVGECTHIGAGAVVKNNTSICDNVVVGAGGVVIKDIINRGVYVGVPAEELE